MFFCFSLFPFDYAIPSLIRVCFNAVVIFFPYGENYEFAPPLVRVGSENKGGGKFIIRPKAENFGRFGVQNTAENAVLGGKKHVSAPQNTKNFRLRRAETHKKHH